jgi:hypothetical protein
MFNERGNETRNGSTLPVRFGLDPGGKLSPDRSLRKERVGGFDGPKGKEIGGSSNRAFLSSPGSLQARGEGINQFEEWEKRSAWRKRTKRY